MAASFLIGEDAWVFDFDTIEGTFPAEIVDVNIKTNRITLKRLDNQVHSIHDASAGFNKTFGRRSADSAWIGDKGFDDMVELPELNQAELNRNLGLRFRRDEIYCFTGPTLVAINPFKELPIWTSAKMEQYRGISRSENPPHPYAVASEAVLAVLYNEENFEVRSQSIVITGESGSGKTYATRKILMFITDMLERIKAANILKASISHRSRTDAGGPVAGEDTVAERVLAANPILDSFGNAKMPRNDDSSRFGKLFKLHVDIIKKDIVGADITPYLLEKSRVVVQGSNERNYHIFYRFLNYAYEQYDYFKKSKGTKSSTENSKSHYDVADESMLFKNKYHLLNNLNYYYYLNRHLFGGGNPALDTSPRCLGHGETFLDEKDYKIGVHGSMNIGGDVVCFEVWRAEKKENTIFYKKESDSEEYAGLIKALTSCGVVGNLMEDVFLIVSGVLLLGNVLFGSKDKNDKNSPSTLDNEDVVNVVSNLLGIETGKFKSCLLNKMITVKEGDQLIPYKQSQARKYRDAIAKDCYNKLFLWIVRKINSGVLSLENEAKIKQEALKIANPNSRQYGFIGVLDIFGFEYIQRSDISLGQKKINSFEQLCINFCNETLQNFFTMTIFKLEENEYKKENVNYGKIIYDDNQPTLDLIEAFKIKDRGLLQRLDDVCLNSSIKEDEKDDSYLAKLWKIYKNKHPKYFTPDADLKEERWGKAFGVRHYAAEVIYSIYDFNDKNYDKLEDYVISCLATSSRVPVMESYTRSETVAESSDMESSSGAQAPLSTASTSTPPTVGYKFKLNLQSMIATLRSTRPTFIRCIKPNTPKKPDLYESNLVLKQLEYTGMLASLQIRRDGFPERIIFFEFLERYHCLEVAFDNCMDLYQYLCDPNCPFQARKFPALKGGGKWNGEESMRVGKTKIFMRDYQKRFLDLRRKDILNANAVIIQTSFMAKISFLKFKFQKDIFIQLIHRIRNFLAMSKQSAQSASSMLSEEELYQSKYVRDCLMEREWENDQRARMLNEEKYSSQIATTRKNEHASYLQFLSSLLELEDGNSSDRREYRREQCRLEQERKEVEKKAKQGEIVLLRQKSIAKGLGQGLSLSSAQAAADELIPSDSSDISSDDDMEFVRQKRNDSSDADLETVEWSDVEEVTTVIGEEWLEGMPGEYIVGDDGVKRQVFRVTKMVRKPRKLKSFRSLLNIPALPEPKFGIDSGVCVCLNQSELQDRYPLVSSTVADPWMHSYSAGDLLWVLVDRSMIADSDPPIDSSNMKKYIYSAEVLEVRANELSILLIISTETNSAPKVKESVAFVGSDDDDRSFIASTVEVERIDRRSSLGSRVDAADTDFYRKNNNSRTNKNDKNSNHNSKNVSVRSTQQIALTVPTSERGYMFWPRSDAKESSAFSQLVASQLASYQAKDNSKQKISDNKDMIIDITAPNPFELITYMNEGYKQGCFSFTCAYSFTCMAASSKSDSSASRSPPQNQIIGPTNAYCQKPSLVLINSNHNSGLDFPKLDLHTADVTNAFTITSPSDTSNLKSVACNDQCMVFLGEHGSGKSVAMVEALSTALQSLDKTTSPMTFAPSPSNPPSESISVRLAAALQVIDSFGCAYTLNSVNSTRYARIVSLCYSTVPSRGIIAAEIEAVGLERGRVVCRAPSQRNFHCFYRLLSGASRESRIAYRLFQSAADYRFLNPYASDASVKIHSLERQVEFVTLQDWQTGSYGFEPVYREGQVIGRVCLEAWIRGKNDRDVVYYQKEDDAAGFRSLVEAMACVGIDSDLQDDVFKTLSVILLLGDVHLVPDPSNSTYAHIGNKKVVAALADLLGLSLQEVVSCLLFKMVAEHGDNSINNEQVQWVRRSVSDAVLHCEHLAIDMYSRLFDWIVASVNVILSGETLREAAEHGKQQKSSGYSRTCATMIFIEALPFRGDGGGSIDVDDKQNPNLLASHTLSAIVSNYMNEKLMLSLSINTSRQSEEALRNDGIENCKSDSIEKVFCQQTLDLFDGLGLKGGVFSAMHTTYDECQLPAKSRVSSVARLLSNMIGDKHPRLTFNDSDSDIFFIKHYAGTVPYKVTATAVAMDSAQPDSLDVLLLRKSSPGPVRDSFRFVLTDKESVLLGRPQNNTCLPFCRRVSMVWSQIMDRVVDCDLSFVRCVTPNVIENSGITSIGNDTIINVSNIQNPVGKVDKSVLSRALDPVHVLRQLLDVGFGSLLRISEDGFCHHLSRDEFVKQFGQFFSRRPESSHDSELLFVDLCSPPGHASSDAVRYSLSQGGGPWTSHQTVRFGQSFVYLRNCQRVFMERFIRRPHSMLYEQSAADIVACVTTAIYSRRFNVLKQHGFRITKEIQAYIGYAKLHAAAAACMLITEDYYMATYLHNRKYPKRMDGTGPRNACNEFHQIDMLPANIGSYERKKIIHSSLMSLTDGDIDRNRVPGVGVNVPRGRRLKESDGSYLHPPATIDFVLAHSKVVGSSTSLVKDPPILKSKGKLIDGTDEEYCMEMDPLNKLHDRPANGPFGATTKSKNRNVNTTSPTLLKFADRYHRRIPFIKDEQKHKTQEELDEEAIEKTRFCCCSRVTFYVILLILFIIAVLIGIYIVLVGFSKVPGPDWLPRWST